MQREQVLKMLEEIGNQPQEVDKEDFYISGKETSDMYDKGWKDGEISMARKVLVWLTTD